MAEATGTLNDFRALQDMLIAELKALHAQIHNLREAHDRQEKVISKLVEEFRQFSKNRTGPLAATEEETHAQFTTMLQTNNDDFAASYKQFNAVMESIQAAQGRMSMMLQTLDYGIKIQQLELQVAQLTKTGSPVAL